jgi:hypothetical protein
MIDPVNESDVHTATRVLDFFDSRSPWNRRLWNIGLSLTLREVLEAAEAVSAGVLSASSLNFLANVAQKIAGTDPGAGTDEEKGLLQHALKPKLRLRGLDYQVVLQQEERVRTAYLSRWANALRGPDPPGAERSARAIASYLLDRGHSSDYLHRWWKYRFRYEPGIRPLADVVDEAHLELALRTARAFDVMVPVSRAIRVTGAPPTEWRTPRQVSTWLRQEGFDLEGIRQDGGFLFRINAVDPDAAVARVSEVVDQIAARVMVGTRRDLMLLGRVWIKGETKKHQLNRVRRGVWVEALERENELYDAHSTGRIDAAIELLSHLQSSSRVVGRQSKHS